MFRSTTFHSPSSKTYGSRSKRTSLRYWPSLRSIRRIRSISRVPRRGLSLRSPLAREGRRSRSRAIVSQTDGSAGPRTRSGVQTLPSSRSRDTSSLRNVENLCGIRERGGRAAMLLPGLLSSQRWLPVRVSVELSAGHLTLQFKNIYSSVACRAVQQERLLHPHSAAVRASAASRGVFISYHDRARSIRRGRRARPTQRKEPYGGSGERSHLPKCFPTCESSLSCIASLPHTGNRLDGVAGLHNPERGGRVP